MKLFSKNKLEKVNLIQYQSCLCSKPKRRTRKWTSRLKSW